MKESAVIPVPIGMVNAYLVRGDRTILIDAHFPGKGAAILKAAADQGIKATDISLILATHGHLDHVGSAAEVKEQTGAPIAVHRLDAEMPKKGANAPLHPRGIVGRLALPLAQREGRKQFQRFTPDILIEGEMDLAAFGVAGRVILTPGHTPGSVSVVLDNGEAIVGDLLMGGLMRHRRPGIPSFADDPDQVRASIKILAGLSPTRVYCAHGGPFELAAIRERFLA